MLKREEKQNMNSNVNPCLAYNTSQNVTHFINQESLHQREQVAHLKNVGNLESNVSAKHQALLLDRANNREEVNSLTVPPGTEKKGDLEEMSPFNKMSITCEQSCDSETLDKLTGSWTESNRELFYNISSVNGLGLENLSNNKLKDISDSSDKENELVGNNLAESFISARSKTMPALNRPKITPHKVPSSNEGVDRLTKAKEIVERAVKFKKVFTIQGGYCTIRKSLRKRGWVEKFYKIPIPQKKPPAPKKPKNSDDDDDNDFDDVVVDDDDGDDDDLDSDQPRVPPWEEDGGIYGIMSRMVRNITPSLFWVLKRDAIDYRYLTKDQMVNHYCKAGSFTTKVGLCVNMKNVVWFDNCDHESFFPRCYRLSHDEERDAFIEDYRVTACMNIVKVAVRQQASRNSNGTENINKSQLYSTWDGNATPSKHNAQGDKCLCPSDADEDMRKDEKVSRMTAEVTPDVPADEDWQPVITHLAALKKKNKQRFVIPIQVLETAIYQCEKFLASKDHEDIDVPREVGQLTDQQWDDLIKWYYQIVQEDGTFPHIPLNLAKQCESLVRRLASHCPQFEMDGIRNVWIVKPGAKSRGRGIMCYEKLEDMLKLVCTQVVKKDGKFVVQKYIERPLLIYNTKFDIRQWFLVTDWNPLTLWFYRDSYLRFCSQQFTLEDFDQSIHLSNNAVQKHYKNGPRSSRLPEENMWTHEEFKKYLASKKHPNVWDDKIYPQMKRAIICALLVTQDLVEYRKSSFELYGADFMLTEDFRPWLIEINSSPSMESSTSVTAKLCTAVLDDTIKVVVDRRFDRNCDIGKFELAYKQPLVTVPPYIGISLCVEGQAIKKPSWAIRPTRESDQGRPIRDSEQGQPSNDILFTPRTVTTKPTLTERVLEHSRLLSMATSAIVPTIDLTQTKKEIVRIPEITSIKNLTTPSARTAKVSTFCTQVDVDKMKALMKTVNLDQPNEVNGAVGDQRGNSSVDETTKPARKQVKIADIKNEIATDINIATTHIKDVSSEFSLQNGLTNQTGVNQRRLQSKSYSTNASVSNTERSNQNRPMAASTVKSTDFLTIKPNSKGNTPSLGSWNRTCQWCGRGGNLHLDAADPNCRCQKDSVLVSMQLGQAANSRITSKDLITFNNHQVHASKTCQNQSKNEKVKKSFSVTPTSAYHVTFDDSIDSKTATVVLCAPQKPALVRPTSAVSTSLDHSKINKLKSRSSHGKNISVISRVSDGVANPHSSSIHQPNEQKDVAELQKQHHANNLNENMPNLTSNQYMNFTNPKPIQITLYNPLQPFSRGLLGSMLTTRVKNFLAKNERSTNSVINMWPTIAYLDSNRCQSPLSVIAQRHMQLKQQK